MSKRVAWNKNKQFCPKGHDTWICGRDSRGWCNLCKLIAKRKDPNVDGRAARHKFCPQGHDKDVVGRDIHGRCKLCTAESNAKSYEKRKDKIAKKSKEYYQAHREEILEKSRKHQKENRAKIRITKRKYRKEHPEVHRLSNLKAKTNRGLRVVSWSDIENINEFERNKPAGMTTDHIIPLQGDLVAGLHVSWNLQYMPVYLNNSKNKYIDLNWASEWYGQILEAAGLK